MIKIREPLRFPVNFSVMNKRITGHNRLAFLWVLYIASLVFMYASDYYGQQANPVLENSFFYAALFAFVLVFIHFLADLSKVFPKNKWLWVVLFFFLYIFFVPVYLVKLHKYNKSLAEN